MSVGPLSKGDVQRAVRGHLDMYLDLELRDGHEDVERGEGNVEQVKDEGGEVDCGQEANAVGIGMENSDGTGVEGRFLNDKDPEDEGVGGEVDSLEGEHG